MGLYVSRCLEKRRLNKLQAVDKPKPPRCGETVLFRVTRVIDGDTIVGMYFIRKDAYETNVRLSGIDCPEMSKHGIAAAMCKKYVEEKLLNEVIDLTIEGWDKFGGRIVGRTQICEEMLNLKFAKPYNGKQKKSVWTQEELQHIIQNCVLDNFY